jgi:hypothetical protein
MQTVPILKHVTYLHRPPSKQQVMALSVLTPSGWHMRPAVTSPRVQERTMPRTYLRHDIDCLLFVLFVARHGQLAHIVRWTKCTQTARALGQIRPPESTGKHDHYKLVTLSCNRHICLFYTPQYHLETIVCIGLFFMFT